jgi:hypothetical protein
MTFGFKLKGGWPLGNKDGESKPVETPLSWGWGSNRKGQKVVTLNYDGGSLLMKPSIAEEVLREGIRNLSEVPDDV